MALAISPGVPKRCRQWGVGHPTTWVLAERRTRAEILEALREGRTTLSNLPPSRGGAPLVLEADPPGRRGFRSAIGTTVRGGSPLRVRSRGRRAAGIVMVRANGRVLLRRALRPGAAISFRAPRGRGWLRAVLQLGDEQLERAPGCEPHAASISDCA